MCGMVGRFNVFRLTFTCLSFLEAILRYFPMPRPLGLGNLENICCNVWMINKW